MPIDLTPPFTPGQKVHCAILTLGFGGSGIAKPNGFTVFVPKTYPGDELWIEIQEVKRRFAFAIPVEWTKRAPERIEPPCPHFDRCGGCHLQHVPASLALEWKTRHLLETFEKIAKKHPPRMHPMFQPERNYGYRNKTTYQVGPDGTMGYTSVDKSSLLPIDGCAIASPALDSAWRSVASACVGLPRGLRYVTLRETTTGQIAVIFSVESDEPRAWIQRLGDRWPRNEGAFSYLAPIPVGHFSPFDRDILPISGPQALTERFDGIDFLLSPGDFFQVHPETAAQMLARASQWREVHSPKKVLDLYCGVGFFSLPMARDGSEVLGIELSRSSILSAERSAKANGLEAKAQFRTGKASTLVERIYREGARFDACVLDPPRKGADPEVIGGLSKLGIRRVLYVSCSPATFARDWQALEAEGFRLEEIHPLDMFPQTYHVELMASFSRP